MLASPRHGAGVRRLLPLDGPLPAWPGVVDRALEAWAACPGRVRVALRAAALVVALAAATGGLVRGPWGPPVAVVVAARTVPAGATLAPADLAASTRPAGLVPAGALADPSLVPPGAVANGLVPAGQVLTDAHLVAAGPVGLAGAGEAVVPVPAELLPPLPVGTRIDLAVGDLAGGATVVASAAVVVADDGMWRWLRVSRSEVAAVAAGLSGGSLTGAVLPPAPRGGGP